MKKQYLLSGRAAELIYPAVCDLPIYDYHCHLSPSEIYLNKPFSDIGEMWLSGDHYKWRLMRSLGIDEHYITGSASWREKFVKYIECSGSAAGNPLYLWNIFELSRYFGIDEYPSAENAEDIYERANERLSRGDITPRSLILSSGVDFIATTDDAASDLEAHKRLAESDFACRVTPSFRCDSLLLATESGFPAYLKTFADASGTDISDLSSLKAAVRSRLAYFKENGCVFSDLGIAYFPDRIGSDEEADAAFKKAARDLPLAHGEYMSYLGNMMLFLMGLYKEEGLIMQLHLGVTRNLSSRTLSEIGRDAGADAIGDAVTTRDLSRLLDAAEASCSLPEMIIYCLEEASAQRTASVALSFRGVHMGAAWWFSDTRSGIEKQLLCIAEQSNLGAFPGMLTDSRSFLSYTRHDYFRRILSSCRGGMVDRGEYPLPSARRLAERLASTNMKEILTKKGVKLK